MRPTDALPVSVASRSAKGIATPRSEVAVAPVQISFTARWMRLRATDWMPVCS